MSLAPLRLRAFRHLLAAYAINQLGDFAAEVGLAVIVFAATHSAAAVAVTWVAHRCAFALLAPLLLARLERYRVDRLLPAIYAVQCALFVALAGVAPAVGIAAVLALVALDGLLAPTARALARVSLLAVTRPEGLHREGNALVNVVFTVNGMLAPAIGGVLVVAVSAPLALIVNAASFLLAALALASCPLAWQATAADPAEAAESGGLARLRDALAYVRGCVVLRGLLGGDAAVVLFVSMITPVEVVLVTDTLHSDSAGLGAVLTAWGVGMVAGGALAARLRTTPLPVLLLGAAAAQGIACLGMGVSGTLTAVLAFSAVGGVGNGAYGMTIVTAIQERTADAYQARVAGLYDALMGIAPGFGFAAGGVLATLAGPRCAYLVAGAGTLAALTAITVRLRAADWTMPEQCLTTATS